MHTVATAPALLHGVLHDPPTAHLPMAEMLLAARQLLGAWDRAMAHWPLAAPDAGAGQPHPPELRRSPVGGPERVVAFRDQAALANTQAGPALTVQMLAGFQVWVGADPLVELPHGKTRSLFKLLLLRRRRPLSRARLCSFFWPELDPAGARNNLNVTLHRLRRALGHASLIRHSDEGYQLVAAGDVWLDTEQFQLHAEMGALEDAQGRAANAIDQYEAALTLYRSDLLDEGEHEPALAADAQALRDRLNQVLERLAELREASGDVHGCLRAALRHLGLDECNEAAHRRLMRCYARLGQIQLAERQYRACVSVLRRQLALSPGEETTRLYRRIAARG